MYITPFRGNRRRYIKSDCTYYIYMYYVYNNVHLYYIYVNAYSRRPNFNNIIRPRPAHCGVMKYLFNLKRPTALPRGVRISNFNLNI
jgi:hypothetical protein